MAFVVRCDHRAKVQGHLVQGQLIAELTTGQQKRSPRCKLLWFVAQQDAQSSGGCERLETGEHADEVVPGSLCRGQGSWGPDPEVRVVSQRLLDGLKRPVPVALLWAGMVYQMQGCGRRLASRGCPWSLRDARSA